MNTQYKHSKRDIKSAALVSGVLVSLLAIYSLIIKVPSTRAQTIVPFAVVPARQQLNIDPGTNQTTVIKFLNQSDAPITGNIKAVDFIVKDKKGTPILLEEEELSTRFSAASWINLPYDRATIGPKDVLRIQFNISAPQDANPGGRYVAVYFEPTGNLPSATTSNQEAALSIASKIAALLYIRVNGPVTEAANITRFEFPSFVEYGPINVLTEIVNNGDYHITPSYQLVLYDWLGRKVDQVIENDINIFPGTARVFESEIGPRTMLGKYRLEVKAAYGEQGRILTATGTLWAFPVTVGAAIALGIVIIILLAFYIWKKLKDRQKQLEKKLQEEISSLEKLKQQLKNTPGE